MESNEWWWDLPVLEIPFKKPIILPNNSSCEEAVSILQKGGFHQIPMADEKGDIKGFITLDHLMSSLISGKVKHTDLADKALIKEYRKVSKATSLGRLSRMLQKDLYAVVLDEHNNGALIGIITQIDLLNFIFHQKN